MSISYAAEPTEGRTLDAVELSKLLRGLSLRPCLSRMSLVGNRLGPAAVHALGGFLRTAHVAPAELSVALCGLGDGGAAAIAAAIAARHGGGRGGGVAVLSVAGNGLSAEGVARIAALWRRDNTHAPREVDVGFNRLGVGVVEVLKWKGTTHVAARFCGKVSNVAEVCEQLRVNERLKVVDLTGCEVSALGLISLKKAAAANPSGQMESFVYKAEQEKRTIVNDCIDDSASSQSFNTEFVAIFEEFQGSFIRVRGTLRGATQTRSKSASRTEFLEISTQRNSSVRCSSVSSEKVASARRERRAPQVTAPPTSPIPCPSKGQLSRMLLERALASDVQCCYILRLSSTAELECGRVAGCPSMPRSFVEVCGVPTFLNSLPLLSDERLKGAAKLLWLLLERGKGASMLDLREMSTLPSTMENVTKEDLTRYRSLRAVENRSVMAMVLAEVVRTRAGIHVDPSLSPEPTPNASAPRPS